MRELILYVVGFIFIWVFVYSGYYITKNVSYAVFYKDMVKQTIQEQVKLECLK